MLFPVSEKIDLKYAGKALVNGEAQIQCDVLRENSVEQFPETVNSGLFKGVRESASDPAQGRPVRKR
jgi:hypothetical protein